jgi:hypothetical protein
MATPEACRQSNLSQMLTRTGYDVVIVCTSNETQAAYWQVRLAGGSVVPANCTVLAVDEDWEGGAGNALGTFYAYQKACKKALAEGKGDIHAQLQAGTISVGMYHTAGKGTRLAPLPGAENNNKPGVKLPALVTMQDGSPPMLMTILESVVKQTGVYAASRKGRLSVFWGDQIFVPSVEVAYTPKHHIDILCFLGPMPSEEAWERDGLQKYGLIAVNEQNDAAQVEKVTHSQAEEMLKSLGNVRDVGPSLGSFSVSSFILDQFLEEFAKELKAKKGKFDTDPHLWMPMTLEEEAYVKLMGTKDVPKHEAQQHHRRMKAMTKKFIDGLHRASTANAAKGSEACRAASSLGLFGAVDVGKDKYWWDYGQLKLYHTYVLRLRDDDAEAQAMRTFFDVTNARAGEYCRLGTTKIRGRSCINKSDISGGFVKSSLVCGVTAPRIEADGAILINVTATGKIVAPPGSILYNIVCEGDLVASTNDVLAGVFDSSGNMTRIKSTTAIDGGKAWKTVVCDNPASFESIYNANTTTDCGAVEVASQKKHREFATQTSLSLDANEASTRKWGDVKLASAIFVGVVAVAYMAHTRGHI